MRRSTPWVFLVLGLAPACDTEGTQLPVPHPISADELALRRQLGVPDDAQTVIVFAQTAHLDIDWQKTFDDYYSTWVESIFLAARPILDAQPRAFYSVAEMAYLAQHLQAHPEELAPLQAHAARGALRIVGGGMTSPDTLLPEGEMLARDFLYGIQFAEDTLGVTPKAAWLPDSFGHGGTAPDILAAAGYTSVAFSRIDGSPTIFEQIFIRDHAPLPGSDAQKLLELGTADFLWQGLGGKTILAHFLSGEGLYCAGDNIDYDEHLEVPGGHIGTFDGDDPAFTDARIDSYVSDLSPYTKTPYMFVPVGCDFQQPKAQLIAYLDGYNQRRYPKTGVWAVAAPFDDYASLVSHWSDVLPTIQGDLAPAYMGFYGSRADIKRGTRDAARPFWVAETFASLLGADAAAAVAAAKPALTELTRSDHHDFVTGTSADDVVANEQMPLLANAQAAGQAELSAVAAALARRVPMQRGATSRVVALNASSRTVDDVATFALPLVNGAAPTVAASVGGTALPMELVAPQAGDTTATFRVALSAMPPMGWRAIDLSPGTASPPAQQVTLSLLDANGAPATGSNVTDVVLSNAHVRAEWRAQPGGAFALTSLTIDGSSEAIAAPSLTTNDYTDTGGLWRLGNEMSGCVLTPIAPSPVPDTVTVLESTPLVAHVSFSSASSTREAWLSAGAVGLELALVTGAAQGTTRTAQFDFAVPAGATMLTSSPLGYAERAPERVYDPTFYPAVGWAEVAGWAVLLRQSTGVRMSTPGVMELMAARDARSEACDVMGGTGSDPGTHRIEWRIEHVASAADAEVAAQAYGRWLDLEVVGTDQAAAPDLAVEGSLATLDGAGVISAIKPADRGGGVVVRVSLLGGPATLQIGALPGAASTVVDLAERDLSAVAATGSAIALDPASMGSIVGLRFK